MSTATQIVTKALRRLAVIDATQDPTAEDLRDGTDALDTMIASWAVKGVDVTLDIPLGQGHEAGIIAMLASRLASDYGMEPPNRVSVDAADGWLALQHAYITAPTATVDNALIYTQGRTDLFNSVT